MNKNKQIYNINKEIKTNKTMIWKKRVREGMKYHFSRPAGDNERGPDRPRGNTVGPDPFLDGVLSEAL